MRVVISGSYSKHLDRILDCRQEFINLGADVLRPVSDRIISSGDSVRIEGDPADLLDVRQEQFRAIAECDLLYIVNPGGYIGPSTTLEIGYACRADTPVCTSETPFDAAIEMFVHTDSPELALEKYRR